MKRAVSPKPFALSLSKDELVEGLVRTQRLFFASLR